MKDFYNIGNNIALSIINKMPQSDNASKIEYARKNINSDVLKNFIIAAHVSDEAQKSISANTSEIRLSIDTIIKNRIKHPEITLEDYMNLNTYINHAECVLCKNNKNLIYYKKDNSIYCIVIKTIRSRLENYITTFHIAGIRQMQKDLKRYTIIKLDKIR